jgi:hypothetical protein
MAIRRAELLVPVSGIPKRLQEAAAPVRFEVFEPASARRRIAAIVNPRARAGRDEGACTRTVPQVRRLNARFFGGLGGIPGKGLVQTAQGSRLFQHRECAFGRFVIVRLNDEDRRTLFDGPRVVVSVVLRNVHANERLRGQPFVPWLSRPQKADFAPGKPGLLKFANRLRGIENEIKAPNYRGWHESVPFGA